MVGHIRRRRILIAALAGAAFAALGVTVASSRATQNDVRELLKSNTAVARLAAATTYRASVVSPTPSLTPSVPGWGGAQFVTHQHGKVRYETAVLFWQDAGTRSTSSPARR